MNTCRKWFVRLLTLAIVVGVVGGYYLYERFTNPDEVRRQVLAKLGEQFPGAVVKVETASTRISSR